MKDYKIIDYRLFDPRNSLFKAFRNDKATCTTISCNNSENCSLFAKGQCVAFSGLGGMSCPYGRRNLETGFTPRARKFYQWINERKERYKDIDQLAAAPQKIASIGDYIYFPYPHWYLIPNLPEDLKGNAFSGGKAIIEKNKFTVELFQQIICGYPRALMGGEIKSFSSEVKPKMVDHLKTEMPEFYKQWSEKYPDTAKSYGNISKVGRYAYIKTLKKGATFLYLNKYKWQWDGEYATSTDPVSFSPFSSKAETLVRVKPEPNDTVKITSDDQVDENTVFKD